MLYLCTSINNETQTAMNIESKMNDYVKNLNQLKNEGYSLRQISQMTYERREKGEDIPYMAILTKLKNGTVTELSASPTSKQVLFKDFFKQVRKGKKSIKVSLIMDLEGAFLKL